MRILPSAFKHGLKLEEILAALRSPIYHEQQRGTREGIPCGGRNFSQSDRDRLYD